MGKNLMMEQTPTLNNAGVNEIEAANSYCAISIAHSVVAFHFKEILSSKKSLQSVHL